MKDKGKLIFLALALALLVGAAMAGCGGSSPSIPSGTGTLSGSAK